MEASSVGGTIHVIVKIMLGFPTATGAASSSRFASSLAKRQGAIHLSRQWRREKYGRRGAVGQMELELSPGCSGSDVVVDVIGYRRHGHSEVDDPRPSRSRSWREKLRITRRCGQDLCEAEGRGPGSIIDAVRGRIARPLTK